MHHRPLFLFVSSAVFALSFSFVGPARAEVFLDPMFDVNGHLVSDDMFGFFYDQLELQALAVPEPSSITLLAGLAAISLFAAGGRSLF